MNGKKPEPALTEEERRRRLLFSQIFKTVEEGEKFSREWDAARFKILSLAKMAKRNKEKEKA